MSAQEPGQSPTPSQSATPTPTPDPTPTTSPAPRSSGVRRPGDPVSKADIEAKLTELKGGVDEQVANVKGIAIAAGVAVVAVLVIGTFLIGRRRGKKLATIIEIRRV
jgi:hypothetical protein